MKKMIPNSGGTTIDRPAMQELVERVGEAEVLQTVADVIRLKDDEGLNIHSDIEAIIRKWYR